MEKMQDDPKDPIARDALEWFVRMREDHVSDESRQAFLVWLHRDEAHVAAWKRAEALWKRFDIAQPEIDKFRRTQVGFSRRNLLTGGFLALAGGVGVYALSRGGFLADHVTGVGERRTIGLPDGSNVELGSYSALSVDFTPSSRRTRLYRGEGFFEVVADPARPFVVEAAHGAIEALGTRFDVKSVADVVTVAVSEHAVRVRAGTGRDVDVFQGFKLTYEKSGVGQVGQADMNSIMAWRQDRIVFQDAPLRRVLTELERYRRGRILLTDSSLGNIPVTAVFDTRQTDRALQTIAETLPVHMLRATDYIVVVYPAS